MKNLIYILAFLSITAQAQEFYTFDMTADAKFFFTEKAQGFSIGNDSIEPYFEVNIIGDLDFNYQTLEIMNAKVTVYGDTINTGSINKRFNVSELVVIGNTLTITNPIVEAVRIFPNPTVNYFFVAGNNLKSIMVVDMHGRINNRFNDVFCISASNTNFKRRYRYTGQC